MSDNPSIEDIRERKRKELQKRAQTTNEPDSPTSPVHVSGQSELIDTAETHDVVLVDFYADWCGPCQMLEPVLEEIAADTNVVVAKVDVDNNQRLASAYNVQGIPTMLFFAAGDLVDRRVGMQNKDELISVIEQYNQH